MITFRDLGLAVAVPPDQGQRVKNLPPLPERAGGAREGHVRNPLGSGCHERLGIGPSTRDRGRRRDVDREHPGHTGEMSDQPALRPRPSGFDVWEGIVSRWIDGDDSLPEPFDCWRRSYPGRGAGAVDTAAIPEPYLGDPSSAIAVVLALNPGRVYPRFQHRGGVFEAEVREMGSYAAWAATWAFVRPPWTDEIPAVQHTLSRLAFIGRWYDEPNLPIARMLAVELYPWHSTRLTAALRPDPGIVQEFIWEPIAASGARDVFAFGSDWFPLLTNHLGLAVVDRLGAGGRDYGPRAKTRSVMVAEAPSGVRVVAMKHSGSAGPPASDETLRLRDAINGR